MLGREASTGGGTTVPSTQLVGSTFFLSLFVVVLVLFVGRAVRLRPQTCPNWYPIERAPSALSVPDLHPLSFVGDR